MLTLARPPLTDKDDARLQEADGFGKGSGCEFLIRTPPRCPPIQQIAIDGSGVGLHLTQQHVLAHPPALSAAAAVNSSAATTAALMYGMNFGAAVVRHAQAQQQSTPEKRHIVKWVDDSPEEHDLKAVVMESGQRGSAFERERILSRRAATNDRTQSAGVHRSCNRHVEEELARTPREVGSAGPEQQETERAWHRRGVILFFLLRCGFLLRCKRLRLLGVTNECTTV
jgi:hypothetical protein